MHGALAEFCGRWSVGLDALADRARDLGGLLGTAAKAYREVEHTNLAALKADPGLSLVSPPPRVGSGR
ncbi:hypothetical protein [Amycolatopsis alba]|uniref:hypothetical protein n=1 Tax=Amycolatopsis alba TaxID=76020 RepID=UPI000368BD1C|nr:hypothetical protein [Amycolatopsis alba]